MTENAGVGAGLGAAAAGLASAAGAAESVVENVMKVEPMVAGIAGMFVPQVALIQPWIVMAAPYLERALKDLQNNNGGDVLNAFIELMQHVSKGQPTSTVLSGDASQQGSG
jgi:hypothetical protein